MEKHSDKIQLIWLGIMDIMLFPKYAPNACPRVGERLSDAV